MAGTKSGGRKIARTIYTRYGYRYFELLGRSPKPKRRGNGFAANRELARIAGSKGGSAHRRKRVLWKDGVRSHIYIEEGSTIAEVVRKLGY